METLQQYFVRELHTDDVYIERLQQEVSILEKLNWIWFLERFIQIYKNHIKQSLNFLRGSAGSSLVLYYLGINDIDPIKYSIPLTRFVNELRNTHPDIDMDVPKSLREQIINDIITNNDDTIRMSNNMSIDALNEEPNENLHKSGIIIYSSDQKDIIQANKINDNQISLTRDSIGINNLKKIDLLSNVGLQQLYLIEQNIKETNESFSMNSITFDDENIYKFIVSDDGIGITYAETPSIQNVIKILKPTNIEQLSVCLAIVRPFAYDNILIDMTWDTLTNVLIFDDDVIMFLSNKLKISQKESDKIRRMLKKDYKHEDLSVIFDNEQMNNLTEEDKNQITKIISNGKKYGFCKSHSLSYAMLIYKLYYCKCHYPKIFWTNTINSINGYYKDWVYIRKGIKYDIKFKGFDTCDSFVHFFNTGYWTNKEFISKCYLKMVDEHNNAINNEYLIDNVSNINQKCIFRGIIAGSSEIKTIYSNKQFVITIGYDNDKFIELYTFESKEYMNYRQIIGGGYYYDYPKPHIKVIKMKTF